MMKHNIAFLRFVNFKTLIADIMIHPDMISFITQFLLLNHQPKQIPIDTKRLITSIILILMWFYPILINVLCSHDVFLHLISHRHSSQQSQTPAIPASQDNTFNATCTTSILPNANSIPPSTSSPLNATMTGILISSPMPLIDQAFE